MHTPAGLGARLRTAGHDEYDQSLLERNGDGDNRRHTPALIEFGCHAATMLCREAWGARAARPGGTPQIPNRMTIPHSSVLIHG